MQFIARNPILAVREKPESGQPLLKADRGIFHHGASLESELGRIMLGAAMPAVVLLKEQNILRSAARAYNAIGPALSHHVFAATGPDRRSKQSRLEES